MIKVGLVMDIKGPSEGGPAKYAGNTILLDKMHFDYSDKFETYLVKLEYDNDTDNEKALNKDYIDSMVAKGHKLLDYKKDGIDQLDYIILSCPYSRLYTYIGKPYIYSEYGMDSISDDNSILQNHKGIYRNATAVLVSTESKKAQLIENGCKNLIIPRKPAYDYPYVNNYDPPLELLKYEKVVMYAPHHTTKCNNPGADYKRYSTWIEFKDKFVELAKAHPEWFFIYKYHPHLANSERWAHGRYLKELKSYSNIYILDGSEDYYKYFLDTDVMITDCISFIGEWLPMKRPLIRLYDNDSSRYSDRAEDIVAKCYGSLHSGSDVDEIYDKIKSLSTEGNHHFKEFLSEVRQPDVPNCDYIIGELLKNLD